MPLNLEAFGLDPPRKYLGMSEIGMCPRKAALRLRWAIKGSAKSGIPDPRPFTMLEQLRMSRGNYLEPLLVRAMEAYGYSVSHAGSDQMSLELGDDLLKGHPDGVIYNPPDSPYNGWLLEIKCTAPYAWEKYTGADNLPEWWAMQAACYCEAAAAPGSLFCIFDTSTKTRKGGEDPIKLIPLPKSPALVKKSLDRASSIWDYVLGGKRLPAKDPRGPWECAGCLWKTTCKAKGGSGNGKSNDLDN